MSVLTNDEITCANCGQVFNKYGFHCCPVYSETKEELIAEYERLVLPQKIKEATDKLNKQWTHAISKSKSKQKAVANRDKEWVKWIESNLMEEIGSLCTREQCKRVVDSEDCKKECPYYCWIERKKEIGL